MRTFFIILVVVVVGSAFAGAPINDLTNNAGVTIITPSTGATAAGATAKNYFTAPAVAGESYPFVFRLLTNQSFVIQDDLGNNIFGIRHDAYAGNGQRHWELNFGSKQQGMVDQIVDMGAGADIGWRINGDLNNSFFFQTYAPGIGINWMYSNTNYLPDIAQVVMFNNYGTVKPTSICGQIVHLTQAASLGAAAGSGGSPGVTIDNNATDISVQITLTTGSASLTTGTLVTYTVANDVAQFDSSISALPFKPIISPANANAANEIAKVFCTGDTGHAIIQARAALTASTVYVWNIFLVR